MSTDANPILSGYIRKVDFKNKLGFITRDDGGIEVRFFFSRVPKLLRDKLKAAGGDKTSGTKVTFVVEGSRGDPAFNRFVSIDGEPVEKNDAPARKEDRGPSTSVGNRKSHTQSSKLDTRKNDVASPKAATRNSHTQSSRVDIRAKLLTPGPRDMMLRGIDLVRDELAPQLEKVFRKKWNDADWRKSLNAVILKTRDSMRDEPYKSVRFRGSPARWDPQDVLRAIIAISVHNSGKSSADRVDISFLPNLALVARYAAVLNQHRNLLVHGPEDMKRALDGLDAVCAILRELGKNDKADDIYQICHEYRQPPLPEQAGSVAPPV